MDVRLAGELAVALGVGLLIGAERERRKGAGETRGTAGIRTFGITSLTGGLAEVLGGTVLLAAATLAMAGLAAVGYVITAPEDRGLTTETALVLTLLLGGLAIRDTAIAAGLAVVVTILLIARRELHRFVRTVLSQQELDDALLFAALALVVLPLLPARPIDPFGVLVPRTVGEIAVLVMAVSAAGYIALRAVGPRIGLPLAGFASGFISGIATIGTMGERVKEEPALERPAVAGAVLSNVSTVLQLGAILVIVSPPTALALAGSLALAGLVAAVYGGAFFLLDLRHKTEAKVTPGRAFDLRIAFGLAVAITGMLFVSAALNAWLGVRGVAIGVALAGFADTHAAVFSVASLVQNGKLAAAAATVPVLLAFTTNTVTKGIVAFSTGTRRFALAVVPGLALMIVAAWLGLMIHV
jgi:uncharacterized membrane protein (DUF4010 family)